MIDAAKTVNFKTKVSASIDQWLERRLSNWTVVGSNSGGDEHICACHVEVNISSCQIKAMPGTSTSDLTNETKTKHELTVDMIRHRTRISIIFPRTTRPNTNSTGIGTKKSLEGLLRTSVDMVFTLSKPSKA